jgi:capsular exopolysaccharide synthesis family protein
MNRIEKIFSKKNQPISQDSLHLAIKDQDKPQIIYPKTLQHQIDPAILRERRIVALQPQVFETSIFKLLRTKILKQLKENNWNSFGITSPTQGSGKTMVAANLAIAIAMDVNQSVLLVDMDLLYPKIDWCFNLNIKNGLKDYITSDKPLSDILISPEIDRLVILPGKGQVTDTAEMISGPKMRNLINEIKSRSQSRIIIFDLPPILAADDVLASTDYYDALLFVIEDGASQPDEIKKALQMVADKPFLGTVLNKSDSLPNYQRTY